MNKKMISIKNTGDNIEADNAQWTFGGGVPAHFTEHIRRSVPLYDMGHDLICSLSDFFVKDDSICYEIGVSVGELVSKLAKHNKNKNAKWIGIDSEKQMIKQAKRNTAGLKNVSIEYADAVVYDFKKSDLIVSYYCIQFIQPKFRQILINKIFESLNWGGAFIWFEKVRGADARFNDILTQIYIDYKLERDFTPEEIISKSRSLKGILEPFSTQGNTDLLKRAGFVDIMTVMKYVCFEGFLAIK